MAAFLIALTFALVAWAEPARADADADCRAGYANPKIDPLRSKLALSAPPSFQQLTDQDRANDEQQAALIEFDSARISCANAQVKELADAPAGMLAAFSRAVTLEQAARADLFTGKLTFGEYNRESQKIGDELRSMLEIAARSEQQAAPGNRNQERAIVRGAAAGARQALPTYNPFPKPIICTSNRRGTLVDTYCR